MDSVEGLRRKITELSNHLYGDSKHKFPPISDREIVLDLALGAFSLLTFGAGICAYQHKVNNYFYAYRPGNPVEAVQMASATSLCGIRWGLSRYLASRRVNTIDAQVKTWIAHVGRDDKNVAPPEILNLIPAWNTWIQSHRRHDTYTLANDVISFSAIGALIYGVAASSETAMNLSYMLGFVSATSYLGLSIFRVKLWDNQEVSQMKHVLASLTLPEPIIPTSTPLPTVSGFGPTGPTGATGAASTIAGPTGPTGPTGAASTIAGPTGPTGSGSGPAGQLVRRVPLRPFLARPDRPVQVRPFQFHRYILHLTR